MKLIVGFVSFPEGEVAKKIAKILVSQKLAFCVKIIHGLESFYMWEGKLQEDNEVYLMIKSQENKVEDIKSVLDIEHPYKVYEFLYHEAHSANNLYTEWINSSINNSLE